MWNHHDWDLDIVDDGLVNENDIIHEGPVPLIQPDQEAEECPFCFCRPCVTDPRFTQARSEAQKSYLQTILGDASQQSSMAGSQICKKKAAGTCWRI